MLKKIVSAVIAVAMVASLCVVSAGATELTDANKSTGYVTEIKGDNLGAWQRTHTGSNGLARTSVTMQLKSGNSAGNGTKLINGHYTSGGVTEGKFAHASFRIASTNSFQIRLRADGSNYQFVNFDNDGSVYATSSSFRDNDTGATWKVAPNPEGSAPSYTDSSVADYYNDIDIVKDMDNHIAYLYVNGKLATYATAEAMATGWRGYLLYTAGSWEEYDYLRWRSGESTDYNYTIYSDTESHKVGLEEVLIDKGFLTESPEESVLYETNSAKDYTVSANGGTLTYPTDDSVTVEGDYFNEEVGMAQNFMRITGYKGEYGMSGNLIYITYVQEIANGTRVEMRLRAGGANQNGHRFTFTNNDGKIEASGFSNKIRILNKDWSNAVNVGILIDKAARKAYSFVDGKQLGDVYDFSDKGEFEDLRMYLNGTAENAVSSLTLSDWSLKLYDSTKNSGAFVAELAGSTVYFDDAENALEVDGDAFGMAVTARKTPGAADAPAGTKLYAAVYTDAGKLVDFISWDYADGVTNNEIEFAYTGVESKVKVFCFTPELDALAEPYTFYISAE